MFVSRSGRRTMANRAPRITHARRTSVNTVFHRLHRVAFDGCITVTATDAKYAAPPTAATAPGECAGWATKAWARRPLAEEVDACVTRALDAAGETDPRRRWAAVCASVISAAGFLTY
jgi:hypothetical protein